MNNLKMQKYIATWKNICNIQDIVIAIISEANHYSDSISRVLFVKISIYINIRSLIAAKDLET